MANQTDPDAAQPIYEPRVDPNYDPDVLPGLDNPDDPIIEPGDEGDPISDTPERTQAKRC